ncbi:MAG: hypothetical protein HZB18_18240 [Chloroflexi bacterium]|nr:hypothetical protein [Chloroflexota bacterium]
MKNPNGKTYEIWTITITGLIMLILTCCILPVKALHWSICRVQTPDRLKDVLFQAFCPEEVEQLYENLYWEECAKEDKQIPPHTEVLISACKNSAVRGVPGGEYLFVNELKTGEIYLLNLRTGEKKQVPNDPLVLERGIFLNSELVWLEGSGGKPDNSPSYSPHYILDLTDGKRYELLDLSWLPLKNGEFDIQNYAYFESAEEVFLHSEENVLIALSPDFRQNTKQNIIFSQSSLGTHSEGFVNGELLEQLMNDLEVNYEVVDFSLEYTDVPSPTGKYVVRHDGIYLSSTDMPVVTREYTGGLFMGFGGFKSWYYDESGVIIALDSYYYYRNSFWNSRFPLPRPILKLNLPAP